MERRGCRLEWRIRFPSFHSVGTIFHLSYGDGIVRSPSVSMVRVPEIPEESMERLVSYGKAVVESPTQIVGRGRCFRVGDGIARCVSVRPRLEGGRMVFRHEFRMLSDPDVKELFGDGVPEDVVSRREEAREVRRLARMVGRFEGLKELVPMMTEYADSLDGGRR